MSLQASLNAHIPRSRGYQFAFEEKMELHESDLQLIQIAEVKMFRQGQAGQISGKLAAHLPVSPLPSYICTKEKRIAGRGQLWGRLQIFPMTSIEAGKMPQEYMHCFRLRQAG